MGEINVRVALLMSIVVMPLLPTLAAGQAVQPDYRVLDTARTATMQKELQEAADRGYRLVQGQGSWLLSAILEKATGEVEPIEYVLLATSRSGTMQKEMAGAAAQGYRFASVLGIGQQVIIAMQRNKGITTQTHEQTLVATSSIKTMERELGAEASKGFRFMGQTVFDRVLGGPEYVAILERPVK